MEHGVVGQLVAAFIASIAYAVVFQVPRRELFATALAGLSGWGTYLIGLAFFDENRVIATFLGGLTVGVMAEVFARQMRAPATVFLVPGIIPLVPGADAYLTMLHFVSSKWTEGSRTALTTILLAGAIAAGLILAGSLFRIRPHIRRNI